MAESDELRIGQLAARTGASVRSLRYYESQGLLRSDRTVNGHRRYAPSDVRRVIFLQRLYASGLTSTAIAEVLPCVDSPGQASEEHAWARMAQERERLSARIEELTRARDSLDALLAAKARGADADEVRAVLAS